jgi:hypothetical protein
MDQGRAALPCCGGRIKENTAAAVVDPGDESRQPNGVFQRGRRGEVEREARAFYSRGDASNRAGIKWDLRGRINREGLGLRRDQRWEEEDDDAA